VGCWAASTSHPPQSRGPRRGRSCGASPALDRANRAFSQSTHRPVPLVSCQRHTPLAIGVSAVPRATGAYVIASRPAQLTSDDTWFTRSRRSARADPILEFARSLLCAEGQNRTGDTWFFSRFVKRIAQSCPNSGATDIGSAARALVRG